MKMALARAKQAKKGGDTPGQGSKGGLFSGLFNENEQLTLSPKTILLCSVAYMGIVILLHIFGKISSIKSKTGGEAPDAQPEGDGDAHTEL